MADPAAHLTREQSDRIERRRRGRNIALMVALCAVIALFYAITIVKFIRP